METDINKKVISNTNLQTNELYFEVDVCNFQKKVVASVKLQNKFWKLPFQEKIVRDLIVSQHASWRQGTKKTKGRGDVSGGGRKPWKQKGTGRARHGSIRSPIWVGGGVTFGPTGKENYVKKMNRRLFRKGLAIILSKLLQEKRIFFVKNDLDFKNPSTKESLKILKSFDALDKKILFIFFHQHQNLYLSLRNLKNVDFIDVNNLSPHALVNADKILFPYEAIQKVEERLSF